MVRLTYRWLKLYSTTVPILAALLYHYWLVKPSNPNQWLSWAKITLLGRVILFRPLALLSYLLFFDVLRVGGWLNAMCIITVHSDTPRSTAERIGCIQMWKTINLMVFFARAQPWKLWVPMFDPFLCIQKSATTCTRNTSRIKVLQMPPQALSIRAHKLISSCVGSWN